ncbi:hypothetical protein [Acinetobacter sp. ANC 3832]|uniref:hypothetical protein n=1 Tax=Acinetobacter sp. ANC 3832 TaxID=1977874 RepID=UPI000A341704|nr:hypothetical protein [Acinetobacter sp. ANC 3832]OTG91140.1 hypothetical protein B9T35_14505 [Acinetobacter sp. ANC 3832]
MNQTLLKQNLKVIFLLHLSLGLLACINNEELEKQDLLEFNQRNAPELKIVDRVLYVDSLGDIENNAPRLKLKVPMNYLQGGINADGLVGQILSTGGGPFGYSRPKDPKEKPQLATISFEITESGQPVTLDKDGRPSNKEDIYGFSISLYSGKRHPVNKLGASQSDLFRAKDVYGLQNYKNLSCRDVEKLKENVRLKGMGYKASEVTLDKLANKAPDDPTPKNCLSNERLQIWISPPEVPDDEAVRIYCGSLLLCEIAFRYKSRGVVIYTRKNRLHVLPKWQVYRQQVIKTIQQFETQ